MELSSKKILIVEDDEIARDVLAMILKKHFENVYVAKNGEEGLAMVESVSPDLVVADLAMPVMDGFRMLDIIKQRYPELPVLIVTAYREEVEQFDDFPVVFKPANRADVLEKIRDILG